MNIGNWYAIGAYAIWGLLPIYLRLLRHVPALQLTSHRIIWSFILLIGIVLLLRQWQVFRQELKRPRILIIYTMAAMLLGINWLTYVWAVNAGFIVETSLGYFINPLLSVLLGIVFFRERLRQWQWVAIGLAVAGVVYLTVAYGRLPWIALTLASTFAIYGLVKKKAPLSSVHGLTLETAILFLPALFFLSHADVTGQGSFFHTGMVSDLLLLSAGPMTTIPLLLFASAAQRIPLSMIGVLQYIAPTMQFLLGVFIYDEPFTYIQLTGFCAVWTALIILGIEGFFDRHNHPAVPKDIAI